MAKNVREILDSFTGGLGNLSNTNEPMVSAFMGLMGTAYSPKTVDLKVKELISVGIACFARCEYCIVYHTYKAFEAGASKEEILEAAMVAVTFGGGPSMAYSVTVLQDSLAEFEKDFI